MEAIAIEMLWDLGLNGCEWETTGPTSYLSSTGCDM